MSKIFKTLLFILLLFSSNNLLFANSWDLQIISRSEWWAQEKYRYLDSNEWQKIIEKWKNTPKVELTEYQKNKSKIESEKVKKANNFLVKNYKDSIWINKVIREENWHKLAWPIAYSKKKTAIVIHHTDSDVMPWDDNYEAIRKIYKYHALSRAWWDIGYNYLIWTNWEIFEWRAWGDFSVWAHDKWNNQSTIWISLIWNFQNHKAWEKQMNSLKKLIKYLEKKYRINFNKKQDFFKWCVWTSEKCQKYPLTIVKEYPLIGHRDAWHTACPWKKLYKQLQDLKKEFKIWIWDNILSSKQKNILKNIWPQLSKLPEYKQLEIIWKIEVLLDKNIWAKAFLIWLKDLLFGQFSRSSVDKQLDLLNKSFDDNNKIKVKLSYPKQDNISFEIPRDLKLDFIKNKQEYILNFVKNIKSFKKDIILDFDYKNNKLFIKNKEIIDFDKIKFLRIKVPEKRIITINSWDRKPSWDNTWNLNDNKFRGDIVLYSKNNKLIVVNELYLNDYLKWLWEISNWENTEKIKTIIVLARSYARWYMTKARKFAWEWFDASDDPNIFQKYLWFWLEKRSPKINKIVEETKDLVVTFDWELIKPWYSSSTTWKTTSFIDYCKNAKWVPDCAHPEKFPFLVWVTDPSWTKKLWHWVWVSWAWVKYFSDRWWSFDMIIKYFLKWVEIERKSN